MALFSPCLLPMQARADEAIIQVGSTNVQSGETFQLPITIDSSTDGIGGFLFGLSFDPSVIQVTGVSAESVFMVGANLNWAPGKIVVLGLKQFGSTAPTGLTLVSQISFEAIGPSGSTTPVEFTAAPYSPVVVCDADCIAEIPVSEVNGVVNVLSSCAGPVSGGIWNNHGQYVSSVTQTANDFLARGLITTDQKDDIVKAAAESDCGKRVVN